MAGLGSLVVSLEANIARFTSDMGRAAQQTEQAMNRMDRSSQQTQRAMNSLQTTAGLATGALVSMMAGMSVQKLVAYSDGWTNISSRIKLVTTSSVELASVQGQLFDIAQRSRADMSSTVALYTRLAQSSDTLGASQKDMIKFTEGVSAAVLLSGSGTAEAAGALQQLSQAMSNANIQAQEYNSINDGAPEILRMVAKNIQGVDGDLGKLRAKMLAGELSSKTFFAALLKGSDEAIASSQGMAMTVGQAYTKLNNETMKFVGNASASSGAGALLATSIDVLSENLDTLAAGIGGLMVYKLTSWTLLVAEAMATKTLATSLATAALAAESVALVAAADATVVSTAAEISSLQTKTAIIAELRAEAIATIASTNATIRATASNGLNVAALQARAIATAEVAALGRAQAAVDIALTTSTVSASAANLAATDALAAKAIAARVAAGALAAEGVTAVAAAEAAVAGAAAELASLQAKSALIAELRIEAIATMAAANATIRATAANGLNVTAIQARSVATAELVALGRAQIAVDAAIVVATGTATAATVSLTAATVAGSASLKIFAAGMWLLANPITAISAALAIGATAWWVWGNKADEAINKAGGEKAGRDVLSDLEKQNQKLRDRLALAKAGNVEAAKTQGEDTDKLASTLAKINELKAKGGAITSSEQIDLIEMGELYKNISKEIATGRNLAVQLAAAGSPGKIQAWMEKHQEYLTSAQKLQIKIRDAKKELGDDFSPNLEAQITAKHNADEQKADIKAAGKEASAEAKNILDGKLKDLESGLAKEQSELQFANGYITELHAQGVLDLVTYNDYRKQALESGLAISAKAYDDEIALAVAYRETLKKGSQREAAQTKIDELRAGKAAAAQDLGQQDKMLSLDIQKKPREDFKNLRFRADDRQNPMEAAIKDYEEKAKIIEAYRKTENAIDADYYAKKELNEADHLARVKEINQRYADDKAALDNAIMYQAGNTADQFYSMLKQAGQEQSALGQAAFLVSKALAVAQILISTNVAAAAAMALPPIGLGPIAGAPYAIGIKAMGYASAAMTAAVAISGAREKGGPVWSGGAFLVGEKGPEIFQPSGHGTIIPNSSMGTGTSGPASVTVNVAVDAKGSSVEGNDRQAKQLGDMVSNAVRNILVQEQRPGGILA